MPEIVGALREGDLYFGVVALEVAGSRSLYRFGVSREGYLALRHALDLRPFDSMPGDGYRHFFAGSLSRVAADPLFRMQIRVEQEGGRAKHVDVDAPRDLIANLLWFLELQQPEDASHLRIQV